MTSSNYLVWMIQPKQPPALQRRQRSSASFESPYLARSSTNSGSPSAYNVPVTPPPKEKRFDVIFKKKTVKLPEFYIERLLSGRTNAKLFIQLKAVLIDVKNSGDWISQFLHLQGEVALGEALKKINKRSIKSNEQLDSELLILECLRLLMGYQLEVETVITMNSIIPFVVPSVLSPRLNTRNLVNSMLTLLIGHGSLDASEHIIKSLEEVCAKGKSDDDEQTGPVFSFWLENAKSLIVEHHVTKQNESSSARFSRVTVLNDYALLTLFLITSLISSYSDVEERIMIKEKFESSGLNELFTTCRKLKFDPINDVADTYILANEEDQVALSIKLKKKEDGIRKEYDLDSGIEYISREMKNTEFESNISI
ncbi:unnamed protein product [Ambrosiozyma monospora]|uniref:Unnamed protein product n=1 Tax=Ambrosiozyma monospora TaxID=43982 RepID=A0A9W7DJT8_AMBMO|nr:unnamed protein product [Ambrosiozyma monospora]